MALLSAETRGVAEGTDREIIGKPEEVAGENFYWLDGHFGITLGSMDERDFYTEKPETKRASYTCPKCRQSSEFEIRWLRRTKKRELPRGANDYDRAKFAKARDYLVRVDDMLFCPNPRCRNRFEIPNSQTVVFV